MKWLLTVLFVWCFYVNGSSQTDTSQSREAIAVFKRIEAAAKNYRLDTSSVPEDKLTRQIRKLRNLRGGFNINQFIEFKIGEELQNGNISSNTSDQQISFFRTGHGKRWLDNAIIWIYRQHFTYGDIRQLVKFYRTSAGQKFARDFPIIIIETIRATELVKELNKK